ncbi:MAG TPA: nuclear transport factor 2 family protein [Burkholderiaceae bacterium]|jgi:hypothetical protein|nr:nuclear transport factor 2 family protein [Burkholderiaceae bacterium]
MNATNTAAPAGKDATNTAEHAAVRIPIEHYFLGHARDDAAHMRQAFLPTAHIESIREGVLTSWPLDVYCERFKGTPAADEAQRRRNIDWIDVSGNSACARITLEHGAMTFVDYFVLLKVDGNWKIANKAFQGQATQ